MNWNGVRKLEIWVCYSSETQVYWRHFEGLEIIWGCRNCVSKFYNTWEAKIVFTVKWGRQVKSLLNSPNMFICLWSIVCLKLATLGDFMLL